MDKTVGIARDRQLPAYAEESFATWWARRRAGAGRRQPVALFATCYVNYNAPRSAGPAVEVLEKAGCDVDCPAQVCCGMPKLDGGDLEGARELARRQRRNAASGVRAGRKILSPSKLHADVAAPSIRSWCQRRKLGKWPTP